MHLVYAYIRHAWKFQKCEKYENEHASDFQHTNFGDRNTTYILMYCIMY